MDEKRQKGKNYTENEKENLLEIIKKYKSIIENKQTDTVNLNKQKRAWEKVCEEYNSLAETGMCTMQQIKQLYKNLKKNTRSALAKEHRRVFLEGVGPSEIKIQEAKERLSHDNKELYKTGGGTFIPTFTETDAQILAIVGDTLEPMSDIYDDDAVYHGDDITQVLSDVPTPAIASSSSLISHNAPKRKPRVALKKKNVIKNAEQAKLRYYKTKLQVAQSQLRASRMNERIKKIELRNILLKKD